MLSNDWDSFPIMLSVKDVAQLLGVGQAKAYALLNQEGFPQVRLGKMRKVSRDALKKWIEGTPA